MPPSDIFLRDHIPGKAGQHLAVRGGAYGEVGGVVYKPSFFFGERIKEKCRP